MGSSSSGARAEPQVVNEESFKVTCAARQSLGAPGSWQRLVQQKRERERESVVQMRQERLLTLKRWNDGA